MPQGQGKLSLAVNCGSSSIKFQLYAEDSFDVILSGAASNISTSEASFKYTLASSGDTTSHDLDESKPYPQVFEDILNEITSDKVLGQDGVERIGIVAHRIVHGGAETEPILIMHGDKKEQETLDRMDEVSAFAPLHNHHAMLIVKTCLPSLPSASSVLCFDTLFHTTIPASRTTYAISQPLHPTPVPLRRYGFHGLSYASIVRQMSERLQKPKGEMNLVIAHLGSGGSVCLVEGGESRNTSMGLTPLEGLPGGTRSGSIDASLIFHHTPDCSGTVEWSGREISKAEFVLNKESGFEALAGTSNFGTIIERAFDPSTCTPDENSQARLVYHLYLDRLLLYITSYLSTLLSSRPLTALVFSGGIGERAPRLRADVLRSIAWIEEFAGSGGGVDVESNEKGKGMRRITKEGSRVEAWVVETDEERECVEEAREARTRLSHSYHTPPPPKHTAPMFSSSKSPEVDPAPAPPIVPSELSYTPTLPLSSIPIQIDLAQTDSATVEQLPSIIANWRASCYLAAAQIFLQGNGAMTEKLTVDHVKPRLLGHWGTTPGLSLAYSHLQGLIARKGKIEGKEPKGLFVCGPGHGAPAILAELFIEGAITKFYPDYPQSEAGLNKFVKAFSWPGGFPSHVNAETPGCIHEGGELGYALAVAYGSVMDSPDLISVVVVGDGESESGPTAAAWHSHKFLDPKESGAVLPVLHVNGFKISERTIPGTMDEMELALLYTGYGYQVRFVEYVPEGPVNMGGNDPADKAIHLNMAASFDWAYAEIRKIQAAARSGKPLTKPRWPMIILRSPKGWTGPAAEHGLQLLNNWASHQVPLPAARTDPVELAHLEKWLLSYEPSTWLDLKAPGSIFTKDLDLGLPVDPERRLGLVKEAYANYKPLDLGDWKTMGYKKGEDVSAMKAIGKYLKDTMERNPTTFRIFSPDELSSNKLDAVFDVTTRNFQWDPTTAHIGGRVTEMLSEHTLQGWLQGYTLTGRTGVFPSYEAFLGIVGTMLVQYSKFSKMAEETSFHEPIASLTYIETSTWTRQEHNGFSHQNPGFIQTVLSLPTHLARVYFPADANTATSVIAHCLKSKNYVNLIVGTKAPSPNFLSIEEAEEHCVAGASIWRNYSIDAGVEPDVVLVGIGFELTHEVITAAALLKDDFGTDLRVRVVNVVDLLIFAPVGEHPHALTEGGFNSLFPPGTPVIVNYHGYPAQLMSLLFNRPHSVGRARFAISGYSEEGSTTTPWMMLKVNHCGRFDVASKALEYVVSNYTTTDNIKGDEKRHRVGKVVAQAHQRIANYAHKNRVYEKYAIDTQQDHPEIGEVMVNREG